MCVQLNSAPLRPYTSSADRLVTAPLQLAAHTQLLLDATVIRAGSLTSVGCQNVQVMHTQPLLIQFVHPAAS